MPYVYKDISDPYTENIGNLMLRRGDIAARSAENIGQLRAHAAEMSGQIAAQAAQSIGQQVAAIPGQIQQAKAQAQESQIRQGQLDDLTQRRNDLKALDSAFSQPGGRDAVLNALPGHLRPTVAKQFEDADKSHADAIEATSKANQATIDAFANDAADVAAHGNDPIAAQAKISHLKQVYAHDPNALQQLQGMEQKIRENPTTDTVKGITDGMIAASPKRVELQMKAQDIQHAIATATETARHNSAQEEISKTTQGREDRQAAETARHNAETERLQAVQQSRQDAVQAETARHNKATESAASGGGAAVNTDEIDGKRPDPSIGNKPDPKLGGQTPNAVYQGALQWLTSGTIPASGMGSSPISTAIRNSYKNKGGAIASEAGMDQPAFRAFYQSNKASLDQLQKNSDSVQSFMNTADRNAALLKTTLDKIPDTGSPLFNQPLRSFEKNVAGDQNLAAMATYLRSVQNEYGRIVAQPNLAGQLTDTARKEASDLVDGNATVGQMLASLEALNKEGSNRLLSLGEQIGRIQQRIQSGPGAGQAPGGLPKVGETFQGGKVLKVEKVQ